MNTEKPSAGVQGPVGSLQPGTLGPNSQPESMSGPARHHALDAVRGGMMLLGVLFHVSRLYAPSRFESWPFRGEETSVVLGYVVRANRIFRMPVFFVMAGFFTALLYARRGPRGLMVNRAKRILVPLIAAWLVLSPAIDAGFIFAAAARTPEPLSAVLDYITSGRLYNDNLHHLWFLYDLLIFYAVSVVVVPLGRFASLRLRTGASGIFRRALQSAWRPILFAVPTLLVLLTMPRGMIKADTSFVPDVRVLVAYGLFFAFGWLLYANVDLLPSFTRHAKRQVALAVLLFPVYMTQYGEGPRGSLPHLVVSSMGAVIVWLLVFGLVGLAIRHLDRPAPVVRYLSESSYWLYLIHYPFVIWFAGVLRQVAMPGGLKALIILVVTVPILLLSYHYWVRPTFLGEWLNGRRYPRGIRHASVKPGAVRRNDHAGASAGGKGA